MNNITEQATSDQQSGIPLMRGRNRYTSTADRATYYNAWLESMRVNGPATRPAPAHAVGADRGRNVHCVCGAEFSRADSLIMHIDGNTGDFGGSWGHPYGMEDYNASKHAGEAR